MSRNLDEKKSDYLLELALEEQLENDKEMRYWEQVEAENPPHVFSERHNKRMKKIFRKARKAEFHEQYRKRAWKIAASFLVLFFASTVMVTQVEAFRLPILNFFYQEKEKSTFFGVQKENNYNLTKNFKEYEPKYMPEGFVVTEVKEEAGGFVIKYENENGQFYNIHFFNDIKDAAIDTEDAPSQDIQINGNKASLIEKEREYGKEFRIIMYKNDTKIFFEGKISLEEAYKVMGSIE